MANTSCSAGNRPTQDLLKDLQRKEIGSCVFSGNGGSIPMPELELKLLEESVIKQKDFFGSG